MGGRQAAKRGVPAGRRLNRNEAMAFATEGEAIREREYW